jgi:Flp pilus assembly protein TadG
MLTETTMHFKGQTPIWRFLAGLRNDRADALIETAILLPLLMTILVGAVDLAMAAYTSIEVSNAALAGVQYGVQSAATAGDTTGIQTAAANDARNITLGPTTAIKSCICADGSASTCKSTDCSGSQIETILTVQTQATYSPFLPIYGRRPSFTLHGSAIQKVLQ